MLGTPEDSVKRVDENRYSELCNGRRGVLKIDPFASLRTRTGPLTFVGLRPHLTSSGLLTPALDVVDLPIFLQCAEGENFGATFGIDRAMRERDESGRNG